LAFLAGEKPASATFLPFGGGRRRCLGMTFAGIEMLVVAATILRRTDLHMIDTNLPRAMFRGITIAPAGGVHVIVRA
jgi:cytochrome P450